MASKKDLEDSIRLLETSANANNLTGRPEQAEREQKEADRMKEVLKNKTEDDD